MRLSDLNTAHQQAARTTEGPVLILAGAGTGKTRTVTTRICHLLELGVPPQVIRAVTFTNKAANEMKERVVENTPKGTKSKLTISTLQSPMYSQFPLYQLGLRQLRRLFSLATLALVVGFSSAQAVAEGEDLQEQGVKEFFAGHVKESIRLWDQYLAIHPEQGPYHWQRGIGLYYAEKFAEGRAQFESHVKVNPQDVENSVWHFLCVARQENVAAARKALLPVERDLRVPMREVLNLFAGKGTAAEVLAAAEAVPESRRRDALCFAYLYLGLYEEALGHEEEAKGHLLKSAVDYAMPHYMGQVAKVHCQLRGWLVEAKAEKKAAGAEKSAK